MNVKDTSRKQVVKNERDMKLFYQVNPRPKGLDVVINMVDVRGEITAVNSFGYEQLPPGQNHLDNIVMTRPKGRRNLPFLQSTLLRSRKLETITSTH